MSLSRDGFRRGVWAVSLLGAAAFAALVAVGEARTSRLQARLFSWLASDMSATLRDGPSDEPLVAGDGPYDKRLGYDRVGAFAKALERDHYTIETQADPSDRMAEFVQLGGFPPYREKTRAGLTLLDREGRVLYEARHPERVFERFEDVPRSIADTLMFIENRELLNDESPRRNPAVEWDRFAAAMAMLPLRLAGVEHRQSGGSTLATQIEKFRHSPDGRTEGVSEKLRQMISAGTRAYLDGEDTTARRRDVLVDYLNSTPLAARSGFGEVNGLGDGLWVWFGTELSDLRDPPADPSGESVRDKRRRAGLFKQALALILAQRRPSYYLLSDRAALERLVDAHLRLLADARVIDIETRDWALLSKLTFREDVPKPKAENWVERKAPNALRNRLTAMLGAGNLYELDRLDVTARSTLDGDAQERVVDALRKLDDAAFSAELGLAGKGLLDLGKDELSRIVYSLTLYERGPDANLLRVQADNLDQPLDINDGAKLDLGSTAKLRTLVSYYQIIERTRLRYSGLDRATLAAIRDEAPDPLTRWSVEWLLSASDKSLPAMLRAATQRRYSAETGETFFTGGGNHIFANFDKSENVPSMTLETAFRQSVNLPFVRLMRDIVAHLSAEDGEDTDEILHNPDHPARLVHLTRFADKEGTTVLNRYFSTRKSMTPDQILADAADRTRPDARHLAAAFRYIRPGASPADLGVFLKERLGVGKVDDKAVADLFARFAPGKFSLNDMAWLARVHPLELWAARWLSEHPGVSREAMSAASIDARTESYNWLFTAQRSAQNTRVRIEMEREAFRKLHAMWKAVGYPFDSLVPSLATAIGSSADRPAALAELMGIILNDGFRLPTVRVVNFRFAEGTPYETSLGLEPAAGRRVLSPEICAVLREAMDGVVQAGTARRAADAFRDTDGKPIPIGGKTGTGDQRFERFAPSGAVIESRAVARTATFAFHIGDRFFGTMTAFVKGEEADKFRFTSALPAQLLKSLAPALRPLVVPEPVGVAQAP